MWFEAARKPVALFLAALLLISVFLGVEATRTWLLSLVEWIAGKLHARKLWHKFIGSLKEISTPANIAAGLTNAGVACLLMVVALDLCVRGIGAQISYPTLLLAFSLPALMGRISAMPGGAGVTEAGMIGVLDAHPGISLHDAAAAVFLFRIGTTLFGAVLGALCYFFGWKGREEDATDDEKPEETAALLHSEALVQSTLIAPATPKPHL
jgi:uncharacterized membrane protein YbhN (UPF0104 family)